MQQVITVLGKNEQACAHCIVGGLHGTERCQLERLPFLCTPHSLFGVENGEEAVGFFFFLFVRSDDSPLASERCQ